MRTRILRKALILLRECSRPAIERNAAAQQKADLASRERASKVAEKAAEKERREAAAERKAEADQKNRKLRRERQRIP